MTPDHMAMLHAVAFSADRPWSAAEFEDLLASPHVVAICRPHGFALTRTLAGESELLTLAVDPGFQRQGIARALINRWLTSIAENTETVFLEVAADNHAARALYGTFGFAHVGTRPAYYLRNNAASADALILRRTVSRSQITDSAPFPPKSG